MAAVLLSVLFFDYSRGCMASKFLLIYFLGVSHLYGCSSFFFFSLLTLLALWPQSNKCLNFVVEDVEDSWLYGRSFSVLYFYASLGSMADKIFHDIEFRDVNDS